MIADGALIDYPTRRDEAWRYSAVDEIVSAMETGTTATRGDSTPVSCDVVDALAGSHGGPRLVFVNGIYDAALSDHQGLVGGLRCGPSSPADVESAVASATAIDAFTAHNRSSGHDVATIEIDPGTHTQLPVHVVHLAAPRLSDDRRATISHPRTVVDVGDGGRLAIIETYCGLDGPTVTNASTSIRLGRDAELDVCRIQTASPAAIHIGDTRIGQAAGARLRFTAVTAGGDVSRHAVGVELSGAAASTDLAGVDITTDRQRHDTVVTVDHTVPRCASTQRFAAVVDEHSKSSFSGEIIVRPGAEGTDAHQSSRNLVLSPSAEADTRPWLQILADDVRCTHGATVGRLDDDAMFYLRTRGIPLATARTMLIEAFVDDVTGRIPHDSLRAHLAALVGVGGHTELDRTGGPAGTEEETR